MPWPVCWAIFRGGPFSYNAATVAYLHRGIQPALSEQQWAGGDQPYITCTLCQVLHCSAGSSPARTTQVSNLNLVISTTGANKGNQQTRGWPPPSAPIGLPSTALCPLCFPTCCQRRRRSRRRSRRGCHTCRWGRWTWRGRGGCRSPR